jgi:hypothetical protein
MSRADLEPAAAAQQLPGPAEDAATQVAGVRVVAEADAWTHPAPIEQDVTPVRVTIENDTQGPIRVRYAGFALVSAKGERYAAIPPVRVEGTARQPVLATGLRPIHRPGFVYREFYPFPYYRPLYPTMAFQVDPFYANPAYFDRGYHDTHYGHWARHQLPTLDMLLQALPEGVLAKGGRISGFIYFERVDPDAGEVTFTADVVEHSTNKALGRVTIPFKVREAPART